MMPAYSMSWTSYLCIHGCDSENWEDTSIVGVRNLILATNTWNDGSKVSQELSATLQGLIFPLQMVAVATKLPSLVVVGSSNIFPGV